MTSIVRAIAIAVGVSWSVFTLQGAQANTPFLTISNPTPRVDSLFGQTVAAIGENYLIGAPLHSSPARGAGAVYLYSSDGVRMRSFSNPSIANGYSFGFAIAALGNDKVLIGAYSPNFPNTESGAVYLFHTNGMLLRTFRRPAPLDLAFFGASIAVLNSDQVVIGAPLDARGAGRSGAVYYFHTNGTLLGAITNPAPSIEKNFGISVSALGGDRILIGASGSESANVGRAYLYDTNRSLLQTFTNPNPGAGGQMGQVVATLGTDLIALSASSADVGAPSAGVVYLFNTNGVLQRTLKQPAAAGGASFGIALTPVGPDKLLVGSLSPQRAGTAYLFSTNGTLLMTIHSPAKGDAAFATGPMAALSRERVLIGARGAAPDGVAYVFELRPTLKLSRSATHTVMASWPSAWMGWELQQSTQVNGSNWQGIGEPFTDDGMNKSVVLSPPLDATFYRLFKP